MSTGSSTCQLAPTADSHNKIIRVRSHYNGSLSAMNSTKGGTVKVKEVNLYSAFICSTSHSRRSGTDHTVLPANYTVPVSTS